VAIEKLIVPEAHSDDTLVSQAPGHRLQLTRQLHLADPFPQEVGHAAGDHIGQSSRPPQDVHLVGRLDRPHQPDLVGDVHDLRIAQYVLIGEK
jgi:hypothetical protein